MIKDFILIALISSIIGIIVGVPFRGNTTLIEAALRSGLSGLSIGFCATIAFLIFFRNVYRRTVIAFFSVFFVIGGGTVLTSLLSGISDWIKVISMTVLAELAGLTATVLFYRRSVKLNSMLRDLQKRLTHKKEPQNKIESDEIIS